MNRSLLLVGVLVGGVVIAIFLGVLIGEGSYYLVGLITVALALSSVFALLGRGVNWDVRLLTALVAGYMIAGKGFAYLSPAPPIYIGELSLAILGALYLRSISLHRIDRFGPSAGYTLIVACMLAYAFLRIALWDFKQYGVLALRDSATTYYALYGFVAYAAFRPSRARNFFLKRVLLAGGLSMLAYFLGRSGLSLRDALEGFVVLGVRVYFPHDDVQVPLFCATVALLLVGIRRRAEAGVGRILLAAIFAGYILAGAKMAYAFSLLGTLSFLFLAGFGRRLVLFGLCALGFALIGVLTLPHLGDWGERKLEAVEEEFQSLDPNRIFTEGGQSYSTSEWRVEWWKRITRDVFRESPILGLGQGADISLGFLDDYFGYGAGLRDETGMIPRYPHSIVFTVLGRLGLLGVLLWGIFFFILARYALRAAKTYRARETEPGFLVLWSYVVAALLNAFVQATFESPYAAIPFWVILGWGLRSLEAAPLAGNAPAAADSRGSVERSSPVGKPLPTFAR